MIDYSNVEIIPVLPDYFGSERGDAIPPDIIGSEIVNFGTIAESAVEGGGLFIDYKVAGQIRRVVLAFSELGMWIENSISIN